MYFLIGISLLFTILLPINVVLAAASSGIWKIIKPLVDHRRSIKRASIVFVLRVLPGALSLIVIFGFVLPSFILYEPSNSDEKVGVKLAIVIGIAMFGIMSALFRIFGSWWRTRRIISEWMRNSERGDDLAGAIPVFKLRHPFPVFAIIGVRRPKIFIAEQLFDDLSSEELHAVITHELGHITALDNLKRLVMRIYADVLIVPLGKSLDSYWSEASELAADEFAVQRCGRSSALCLASALIKIARVFPNEPLPSMPAASFVADHSGENLSRRICNLVEIAERDPVDGGSSNTPLVASLLLLTSLVVLLATDVGFLARIHYLSEAILSILQ